MDERKEEEEIELMSYDKAPKFFNLTQTHDYAMKQSPSRRLPTKSSNNNNNNNNPSDDAKIPKDPMDDGFDPAKIDPHDVFELLNYYRSRCAEFDVERKEYLDRFAALETSHETIHRLKWDLKMKNDETKELQRTVSQLNTSLFEEKEKALKFQAEIDALVIQEMEDRKRIQHLLALTQPVTEEVTFFRDCRPGRMTRFPLTSSSPDADADTTLDDSVNLAAEIAPKTKTSFASTKSRKGPTTKGRKPLSRNNGQSKQNRVLRTVYLPSEQADTLMRTIEMLKAQMAEQKKLFEEKIEALVNDRAGEQVITSDQNRSLENQLKDAETKLLKVEEALRQTTKDYLATRYNAHDAERRAYEELSQMRTRCKQLEADKEAFRHRAQLETQAVREAIQEEGNICAEEFRKEAISREQELNILKEQYAAVQKTYTTRIKALQDRLSKFRYRYKALEQRRRFEIEGFSNDVINLKRELHKIETLYYGAKLSKKDRDAFRLDVAELQNPERLGSEIADLTKRFKDIGQDLEGFYAVK